MTRWFGYQLHLVVDARRELPVAHEVVPASTSEVARIVPMVEALATTHPEITGRCRTLAADRGLDAGEVNRTLWQEYGITPVIDTRLRWKDKKREQGYDPTREIPRALDPGSTDTALTTERGRVCCVRPMTGTQRPMAFWGFEADRQTLRSRCPAAACKGVTCAGRAMCEGAAGGRAAACGRVVRVPLSTDWRIFTPIPRDSPRWSRLSARRTSGERVNARIDRVFGVERYTLRGLATMQARVGLTPVVMLAIALAASHPASPAPPRRPPSPAGPRAQRPPLTRSILDSTFQCRPWNDLQLALGPTLFSGYHLRPGENLALGPAPELLASRRAVGRWTQHLPCRGRLADA